MRVSCSTSRKPQVISAHSIKPKLRFPQPLPLPHPLQGLQPAGLVMLLYCRNKELAAHGTLARWSLKALRCVQLVIQRDLCTHESSPGIAALPIHLVHHENNAQGIIQEGLLEQLTDPHRQSAYDMRHGIMLAEQAQLLMLFLFIRILNPTFFFNKNKSSMTICPRL